MARTLSLLCSIFLLITACSQSPTNSDITVTISSDSTQQSITIPSGSTVQKAINVAMVSLSSMDRVVPPLYSVVSQGMTIEVIRVREDFESQQIIIPFERQQLRNESLPSGELRLIQAGQNGIREVTIRHLYENNIETSETVVSENILQQPVPEIIMVGVQSPFAPISIPGKIAYLTGGNAWIMETSTSIRKPLVTSSDLDGYVFALSPDGRWLLFTRKSKLSPDQEINSLWVINTTISSSRAISLGVSNVVHFAAWQPGKSFVIAYSTVEPRSTAPGWQANNDLHLLSFENSSVGKTKDILEVNAGGIYGWWGMTFAWSPEGEKLAYSRPDGIGLVDFDEKKLTPLLSIVPYNTHSEWAWTPEIDWSKDGQSILLVSHAQSSSLVSPEESPNFDLVSASLADNIGYTLVQKTGMFTYPSASPVEINEDVQTYKVAFLSAIFPNQSATSRYVLQIMDKDGSAIRQLFPDPGQSGLEPQKPVWAPFDQSTDVKFLGIIYEGNLWLLDINSNLSQQVTGDGLTVTLDWK